MAKRAVRKGAGAAGKSSPEPLCVGRGRSRVVVTAGTGGLLGGGWVQISVLGGLSSVVIEDNCCSEIR